jgi:hypothetical protein
MVLASAVILKSESRGTHDHILLSQILDSHHVECLYPPGRGWPSYSPNAAEVTMIPHKGIVTRSSDAILNEVGWTTAVYPVGAQPWPGGALEHSFGTPRGPAGQRQSGGLISMTTGTDG